MYPRRNVSMTRRIVANIAKLPELLRPLVRCEARRIGVNDLRNQTP
jgi:hypothetical protein